MTHINLATLETRLREQELEALWAFEHGAADAPIVYRASGSFVSKQTEEELSFVASDESPDRMGDVVHADGWELKNFKKNPVFLYIHNAFMPPIGSVPKVWSEGKQLLNTVRFDMEDPLAAAIRGKYERGFMRAVSVGFRPMEFRRIEGKSGEDGLEGGIEFTKQELLEISAVPIPAHPAALRKALQDVAFRILVPDLSPIVSRGAISYGRAHPDGTPKAARDAEWDAGAEVASASVDDLKVMCAWVDSENADNKTAYKLPHHRAGGEHPVVFRAVAAALGVLNGARGGADIPDADVPGAQAHLERHRREFGEEGIMSPPVTKMSPTQMKARMRQMAEQLSGMAEDMDSMAGDMGEKTAEPAEGSLTPEAVQRIRDALDFAVKAGR